MAGEKILIVDPSPNDIRPLIEGLLDPEGYIVVHALDGEEGLRQALHGNPDLVIAELAAPQRSGLDLMTQLHKAGRNIPFILIGVSGSTETFRRALRTGVIDYLLKPLDLGEARSAIIRALTRKKPTPSPRETGLLARGFEQINRQLEKRVRELSILQGIGKAVASVLDLEKLLKRIVEAAVYLTGAEEGFLLLLDRETNELYMRAGQGLGQKFASGFRLKSGDSLSWQVVKTGKPAMISSVTDEEKFKLKTGYLVKALLHVPLKLRKDVIGVLSVDNKISRKQFSDNDLHLLSALADYASIAIDNARLYERAEAEAAKYADQISEQPSPPPPPVQPAEETSQTEAVPTNWLVQTLEAQQKATQEGLRATEKLTRELQTQLTAVEQLAQHWRDQQVETEGLVRRLASSDEITVDKSAHTAVFTSANLQKLLDNLTEGLIITDKKGVVTFANGEATRMLGSGDVVGQDLWLVSPSPHWSKSVDRLWKDGARGNGGRHEITFWNNERLIKANFVPLAGTAGKASGWAVFFRDMSRERAAQLTREDLTSAVSDELRTPMTILTSYTDLLLAEIVGLLVPVQRRLLERMRVNLTRMSETLNNLLTVPSTARREEQDSLKATDLNAVVQEALIGADPWLAVKHLKVEVKLEDDLPQAAVEPDCLYQVITNLLQNAARITPTDGTIEIYAETDRSDGLIERPSHVVISVRDQGGGIAPQFLGQVFEHFYSEEDQPIPGLGGKGDELSSVKRLVEAFGGRVWVETEPGEGSTLSFVLPTADDQ